MPENTQEPIEGEVVEPTSSEYKANEEPKVTFSPEKPKKNTLQILDDKGFFKALGIIIVLAILAAILSNDDPVPAIQEEKDDSRISFTLPIKTVPEIKRDLLNTLGLSDLDRKLDRKGNSVLTNQRVVEEESAVINTVETVSPSVVSILFTREGFDPFSGPVSSNEGIGTGFIVDKTGLIVTNAHVVSLPDAEYSVVLKDGSTYDVTRVSLDEASDLAILEIEGKDLPVVDLGDSSAVKVGQTAVAIGNALGQFSNSVTVGVVSGLARELTASGAYGDAKTYENVIQTDAALNPGNSGGPLLNLSGQVIGINVATTRGADNIGFAIPVNVLKPLLEGYLKEGRLIRPYMGVTYTMISEDIARLRDFPQGAYITRVMDDTPASRAGLERGDIVIEFDGVTLDGDNTLSGLIREKKPGDKVSLVVVRGDEELTLVAELEELPQEEPEL
jgi:S1-C subfamily serine protease